LISRRNTRRPGRTARAVARKLSNFVTAALLGAAVAVSAATSAAAQSERHPAGPANMFRPGAVFLYYDGTTDPARIEGLNAAINTMTVQSAAAAATISAVRSGIEEGVVENGRDTLAQTVVTSIEGTFSIVVQAGFLRALARTDPAFGQMLQTAQMNLHLPNGDTVEMPVLMAAAAHSLTVVAAGDKMRAGAPARDLAGTYAIATTGTCAVPSGTMTLRQQDFLFEGTHGESLVLFGAVGDERIYAVSNEQRYARITDVPGQAPGIEVPDQPSDLFEAELPAEGTPLSFRSITRGTCSFTLTKGE